MTSYVILKEQTHDELGEPLAQPVYAYHSALEAPSSEEAARKVGEEGTFAPIPTRSWNVYTNETESKPRLRVTRKGSTQEL